MSLRVIQGGGFRQRKKATKIERLKSELSIVKMANKELIERLKLLLKTMKEFEKESNWVVRETEWKKETPGEKDTVETIPEIIWIGEGDPLTIAGAVLKRIRGATEAFDRQVEVVKNEEDKDSPVPKEEEPKVPFVVYGPDSMPAGGMVVAPEKKD